MVYYNRLMVMMTIVALAIMVAVAPATAADEAASADAVATTTAAADATSRPAEVSPDAAPILQKVAKAYGDLKALDLAGTLGGEFEVDGQTNQQAIDFTASFAAPNQFRHSLKEELVSGSTGEQLYVLDSVRKLYRTAETSAEKKLVAELPDPFGTILLDQNLSLALAVSSDPAADLGRAYSNISKAEDVTIDGKAHPALALKNDRESVTLALDPQTNLVRRVTIDMSDAIKRRGAKDVKRALVTMDYSTSKHGAQSKPDQFAWTPPAGARDAATLQGGDRDIAAFAMVGKPAPDFALKDLSDKDVKFSDLRGNVLVLDFWATWCPPCVASMPEMNRLAAEKKDQGLKVLAVNQGEEKELVAGFINSRNLNDLRVLLDSEQKVAADFMADEVLPTTIVVGKDGVIRKVIAGGGPEAEAELRTAVEAALGSSK